ncbi:MAG: ArsR/SmtB family transcription factor [Solirubrobacteraceae bacterium]
MLLSVEDQVQLTAGLEFDQLVSTLRAVAEPTRLRLIALLAQEELTVTEISRVIGQSQPRTSRHLRLLVDAGILEREPEGAYVYYRLAEDSAEADLAQAIATLAPPTDPNITADLDALARVRRARTQAASALRSAHAEELEALRGLYAGEEAVEAALLEMLTSTGPIGRLLDIGTGTGKILELLAPHTSQSVGLDCDHDMLSLARATLSEAQLSGATVRHGDLHRPPFEPASFDVAVMHHVLRLLDAPGSALADAARLLRPGGRLLVADFDAHDLEELRSLHGHRRLGVSTGELAGWAADAGLRVEQERALPPGGNGDGKRLTVKLWLLRIAEEVGT